MVIAKATPCMGGVGPADRLPPVTALVQQVASQKVRVADPAGYDSSCSTRSVRPRRPWRLTLDELSEFQPVGSELPLELDIPWTQQTSPSSSPAPATTSASLDALLAPPSSSPPSPAVPSPPVSPAAPVQLPATPRAPAAPSPVASARAPSLSAEAAESDEENPKEE
ncbi:hypothetical protein PC129_g18336 [Phytophthora cactorum]|uniref:Uncharacterized protein n=1 Tax=Phytophthora cactorum TaxID=29920 RepID=A0A8T1HF77_9STRA|nr:hypothetical protein PC114_g21574 [Phytophthora cactorum]KAG2912105.1 hypothetical protein PC117_g18975 [Phytophthora cactorum]KAG3210668.1 hypothetical protein PC129_g18336 [Phytophthora cactorum]